MYFVEKIEDNRAWSHTKGNYIGQRIEFLTYIGRHFEGSSNHSIEEIKHGTYDNHQHCIMVLTVKCATSSYASANEIAASKGIRNVTFNHQE